MADIIKNDTGFLIIKTTKSEILKTHILALGICDMCLSSPDHGYFIAVLNYWACEKCYNEWISSAIRYDEDIDFEQLKFNQMLKSLSMI